MPKSTHLGIGGEAVKWDVWLPTVIPALYVICQIEGIGERLHRRLPGSHIPQQWRNAFTKGNKALGIESLTVYQEMTPSVKPLINCYSQSEQSRLSGRFLQPFVCFATRKNSVYNARGIVYIAISLLNFDFLTAACLILLSIQ